MIVCLFPVLPFCSVGMVSVHLCRLHDLVLVAVHALPMDDCLHGHTLSAEGQVQPGHQEPDKQGYVGRSLHKTWSTVKRKWCGAVDTEEAHVLGLPRAFKMSKIRGGEGECPGPGKAPEDFMPCLDRTGARSRCVSVVKSHAVL